MTIATTTNRVSYAGNGSTTVFSFPYYFLQNADLVVIKRNNTTGVETTQVITTNYTVSGAGVLAGGSITMLVAPASGETLIIYRDPAKVQDLDLVENDPMPAEEIEERLDKLTMISQRLQDQMDRAVTLTDGFSPTFDPTLPEDLDDAGDKVPLINAAGTGFADAADWPSADDINDAQANATAAAASAAAAAASQSAAAASAATAAALVGSVFYRDVVYKTFADSPVTVAQADSGKLFVFDSSGGAIAVTLPQISGLTLPFNFAALLKTAGNNVTFTRSGTDTIMGSTAKVLSAAGTGFQSVPDTDGSPDDWSTMDFGTVADGSVTTAKLADANVTRTKLAAGAVGRETVTTAKTTTYVATVDDDLIPCSTSGGAFTVTLYTAVGNAGRRLKIIKTSSDFNALTIDGNSSETINGAAVIRLHTQHEAVEIESDGSNWFIVSRRIPSVWTAYTPTHTNFGTITSVEMHWRRVGDSVQIRGKWINGTCSAAEGRISLPTGLTSAGTGVIPSIQSCGHLFANNGTSSGKDYVLLSEPSVTYCTFGELRLAPSTSPFTKLNANETGSSIFVGVHGQIPIVDWEG